MSHEAEEFKAKDELPLSVISERSIICPPELQRDHQRLPKNVSGNQALMYTGSKITEIINKDNDYTKTLRKEKDLLSKCRFAHG